MADGELKDMEYFFNTIPTPFNAFDSEAYKTSVVGECNAFDDPKTLRDVSSFSKERPSHLSYVCF